MACTIHYASRRTRAPLVAVNAAALPGAVPTRAARALGMSERHLRYKLRKYHLGAGGADA